MSTAGICAKVKNQYGTKLEVTSQRQAVAQILGIVVGKGFLKNAQMLMSQRVARFKN